VVCDPDTQCTCVKGSIQVQLPRFEGEKCALINGTLHALSALNQEAVASTGVWNGTFGNGWLEEVEIK
jgi:hypothetical protein